MIWNTRVALTQHELQTSVRSELDSDNGGCQVDTPLSEMLVYQRVAFLQGHERHGFTAVSGRSERGARQSHRNCAI